jgi:gliding motility-associated-like protein
MPKTTTYVKVVTLLTCLFALASGTRAWAQFAIGAPNLEFNQACANASFNTFSATFAFTPEQALGANNSFILELSDGDGNFDAPTQVFSSSPGAITSSPATISFALPTNTAGEGYKIRVRSTNPAVVGARSAAFAAYYKIQDSPFTINNLEPTATFCPGGSYLLTIDNPGTGNNDSPLQYPQLTFNWFRVTSSTTSIFVAKGDSLEVSQEGTYFAETDYGTCTSDSFSNRVTVTEAEGGGTTIATITSSLGNPFCNGNGPTILSTIEGNSYQWSLNGEDIPGATNSTYSTEISGTYSVVVGFGSCQAVGSIELVAGDFQAEIDVAPVNEMMMGESLLVNVITDAQLPIFEWFLNGEPIENATENSYEATDFGNYTVAVTQTEGCNATKELIFQITELTEPFPDVAKIPNIVSPNGDGINDTWIIPLEYTQGSGTDITILSSQGEVVFKTNEYTNNWPDTGTNLIDNTNQVFYYRIVKNGQEPIQGTLTIVR